MSDLQELKAHVRWLEDERLSADAVEERLDEINDDIRNLWNGFRDVADAVNKNTEVLKQIADAINQQSNSINRQNDALKHLAKVLEAVLAPKPPPGPMADFLGAVFKPGEPAAAKPKPRKPKLSVVPTKDGDEGPGASA